MANLENFGYRELDLACDLLQAIKNGYPNDFDDDGVDIEFNPNSGEVYLINEYGDVAIESDGELYSWYITPYYGIEGTAPDLYERFTDGDITQQDDLEYLVQIFENSDDAEEEWVEEVQAELDNM